MDVGGIWKSIGFCVDTNGSIMKEPMNNLNDFLGKRIKREENEEEDVFSLFRKRKIIEAARFCIKNLNKQVSLNVINLAFLLRYGKIGKDSMLLFTYENIPLILSNAVKEGDKYALMNISLYYIEIGEYENLLPIS